MKTILKRLLIVWVAVGVLVYYHDRNDIKAKVFTLENMKQLYGEAMSSDDLSHDEKQGLQKAYFLALMNTGINKKKYPTIAHVFEGQTVKEMSSAGEAFPMP